MDLPITSIEQWKARYTPSLLPPMTLAEAIAKAALGEPFKDVPLTSQRETKC